MLHYFFCFICQCSNMECGVPNSLRCCYFLWNYYFIWQCCIVIFVSFVIIAIWNVGRRFPQGAAIFLWNYYFIWQCCIVIFCFICHYSNMECGAPIPANDFTTTLWLTTSAKLSPTVPQHIGQTEKMGWSGCSTTSGKAGMTNTSNPGAVTIWLLGTWILGPWKWVPWNQMTRPIYDQSTLFVYIKNSPA